MNTTADCTEQEINHTETANFHWLQGFQELSSAKAETTIKSENEELHARLEVSDDTTSYEDSNYHYLDGAGECSAIKTNYEEVLLPVKLENSLENGSAYHVSLKLESPVAEELNIKDKTIPENEKLFVCHLCDYRSSKQSCIKQHMKIHVGEKPYTNMYERKMDEVDSEKLIPLIEARPELYDKKLKGYNDRQLKQKLWLEICESMITGWAELPTHRKTELVQDLQKRWRSLRDCFKREERLIKNNKSRSACIKKRKYLYYEQLQFLKAHTESKEITGSITDEEEVEETLEAEGNSVDSPIDVDDAESAPQVIPTLASAQKKCKKQETFEQNILTLLNKGIENRERQSKENEDEDRLFALSLVHYFKTVPEQYKLLLKSEILQVIDKYRRKPPLPPGHLPPI